MLRSFNVERTAQAAAVLLGAADGRRMPYIRLLKLLYLADRESIAERGFPITGDEPFAMKHGPVLSTTYDLLKGRSVSPTTRDSMAVWKQWIRTVGDYDVELAADPGYRKLSRYEVGKLKGIVERYAGRDHWELIDELHQQLPEWQRAYRNDGSSHPIELAEILAAVGQAGHADAIAADADAHRAFADKPA